NGVAVVFASLRNPDTPFPCHEVRAAITSRTRMIMLNTPLNPAAVILTAADIRSLISIVDGTDITILSDEVYEHIIFDGAQHESMARHAALRDRSFVVGSFGKTYSVTGWKMGYVAAPAPLTAEFRKAHQFVTFSSFTPVQYALADFLNERRGWPELSAFYQRKRDYFLHLLE